MAQRFQIAEELELAVGVGLFESLQKEAAEQAPEHGNREKESRAASRPLAVGRQSATGHNAVQVGMQASALTIP